MPLSSSSSPGEVLLLLVVHFALELTVRKEHYKTLAQTQGKTSTCTTSRPKQTVCASSAQRENVPTRVHKRLPSLYYLSLSAEEQ